MSIFSCGSQGWNLTRLYLCVHRAAMKMANMDHVFDYMFTNPKDCQGVSASNFQTAVLSQRIGRWEERRIFRILAGKTGLWKIPLSRVVYGVCVLSDGSCYRPVEFPQFPFAGAFDKGVWCRTALLCWCVCWSWRLLWICLVEAEVACKRIWHDLERTKWF